MTTAGKEDPGTWQPAGAGPALEAGFGSIAIAPPQPPLLLRQVHGARVLGLDEAAGGKAEGDGLVVDRAGHLVAVATADCVPVLLLACGRDAHWAAAVHAGWRGMLAGVLEAAVAAAVRAGIDADSLVAALGPSIGPCCYEVGDEVGSGFDRAGLGMALGPDRRRLDLAAAGRELLLRAGLAAGHVETLAPCTRCYPDRYFSYRGGAGPGQRQLSWIGWRPDHRRS